jgi:hypothetical protein
VDAMTDRIDRTEMIDRTNRCAYQLDMAAFMMGGLSLDEHQVVAAHLVDCDRCNADIAEMLPVLALLDSSRVASANRVEDVPSSSLRQHVVSAVGRAGSDAVLASVRELHPGSSTMPSVASSTLDSSAPGSSGAGSSGSGSSAGDALAETQSLGSAVAKSDVDGKHLGSVSDLVRPKRLDRRLFAVAAAAVLAIGITVTTVRKTSTPGTSYELVALQKDPLRASAKINTKSDTTVAEFVVNGTIPDEIYFAWFEDPEGKRIGLGSFRGAKGPVKFRGQTGVPRAKIVAVGASTKAGDKPTDRIRAELPKG